MFLIVRVSCLPGNLTEDYLRFLHQKIVGVSVKAYGIRDETSMLALFPKDMMTYGLGTEIFVEVIILKASEDIWGVRASQLRTELVKMISGEFPKAAVIGLLCNYKPEDWSYAPAKN